MNDLKNSKTVKNLMQAFAGENQARNRYAFTAGIAQKKKLPVIQAVFLFTADREKEHAEVFYDYMKELTGEIIYIDGGYPVGISQSTIDLLKAARHNEMEEYGTAYKAFDDTTKEESFTLIGGAFHRITEIEKTHVDRFNLFAELMEKSQLFVSGAGTGWVCLNCDYVHQGARAPTICPVRKHEQRYFVRLELAPYME